MSSKYVSYQSIGQRARMLTSLTYSIQPRTRFDRHQITTAGNVAGNEGVFDDERNSGQAGNGKS